jgi:hypothetical protein
MNERGLWWLESLLIMGATLLVVFGAIYSKDGFMKTESHAWYSVVTTAGMMFIPMILMGVGVVEDKNELRTVLLIGSGFLAPSFGWFVGEFAYYKFVSGGDRFGTSVFLGILFGVLFAGAYFMFHYKFLVRKIPKNLDVAMASMLSHAWVFVYLVGVSLIAVALAISSKGSPF